MIIFQLNIIGTCFIIHEHTLVIIITGINMVFKIINFLIDNNSPVSCHVSVDVSLSTQAPEAPPTHSSSSSNPSSSSSSLRTRLLALGEYMSCEKNRVSFGDGRVKPTCLCRDVCGCAGSANVLNGVERVECSSS